MNFAAVLAGGSGTRMTCADTPKQFLPLGGKPVIVYAVDTFLQMSEFEKVLVLCPEAWIEWTKGIFAEAFGDTSKLAVIKGGSDRNETIRNAVAFIEENYGVDDETVLCTHDAVRPFVTRRMIRENLEAMGEYDACDTVVRATDTIVDSTDGKEIDSIPDRKRMYQGQTPQTFKVAALKELQDSLLDDERAILTDACKIFVLRGRPVALVEGEAFNIKITYPSDLKMAEALLGMAE